jgi:hypothetical protein
MILGEDVEIEEFVAGLVIGRHLKMTRVSIIDHRSSITGTVPVPVLSPVSTSRSCTSSALCLAISWYLYKYLVLYQVLYSTSTVQYNKYCTWTTDSTVLYCCCTRSRRSIAGPMYSTSNSTAYKYYRTTVQYDDDDGGWGRKAVSLEFHIFTFSPATSNSLVIFTVFSRFHI